MNIVEAVELVLENGRYLKMKDLLERRRRCIGERDRLNDVISTVDDEINNLIRQALDQGHEDEHRD